VFAGSLEALFGSNDTAVLSNHLDRGGGDRWMNMDTRIYDQMMRREDSLKGG